MVNDNSEVSAIILSGGKSSRMGMEKGLIPFHGRALVSYAIDTLKQITQDILISANSKAYVNFGLPVVFDEHENIGPMGGIHSCLKQSKSELNIVLSCDMPFITSDIFELMLDKVSTNLAVVPWYKDDHFEPMCAIYNKALLAELERFIAMGNYKLPDLFKQVPVKKIDVSSGISFLHDSYFFNVNTVSDLTKAEKIYKSVNP